MSLKSDYSQQRYSDKTIFKMADIRHLEFSKFHILLHDLCLSVILLLHTKFHINRTINSSDIAKNDFQYGNHLPFLNC